MKINDPKNRTEGNLLLGIDIGSTTAKLALIDDGELIYSRYERHFSQVRQKTLEMVEAIKELLDGRSFTVAVSGSAGMGMANAARLSFVQEVYATAECVRCLQPDTDAVIELGGEDAKIIFFTGGLDERMNGSCAGGTGAFIDQMATLLNLSNTEMDELSLTHQHLYPIASRCGVFAKTDIQPLINQGATKADIAASIYQAVVNQTVGGLAQGRRIEGKVMFLGGPLHYCMGLRERFVETLKLNEENAIFPGYGLYAVAIGASLYSEDSELMGYEELVKRLKESMKHKEKVSTLPPLFKDKNEYQAFIHRHTQNSVKTEYAGGYTGDAYIGIDCGSTTTKLVVITDSCDIIYTYYSSNKGNPVQIVQEQLTKIYDEFGDKLTICGCAVTGYGEELIKRAFSIDFGLVETMAHYTAAKFFDKNVDFILDIGGQDIKCFKIRNNSIDSIMLNEACSSGCGSFIETFAQSMGYTVEEFARQGLFSMAPVDLGTRCTVFMNSSVKQAQKDGASVQDISAGLSLSVVKNAIYKVIRATTPDELGQRIVVQGGTFMNDAVLRCFEKEIRREVVRPNIAGLMGAFGAALYAKEHRPKTSSILDAQAVRTLRHESRSAVCKGCTNNCRLTINIFNGKDKLISGNQCEKGAGIRLSDDEKLPNLYEYKRQLIENYQTSNHRPDNPPSLDTRVRDTSLRKGRRKIGLPMALGMYELYPLWHTIFTQLGFEVVGSGFSTRKLYQKGQFSIPSDTVCYPAKLMHGHIETLLEQGVDAIFYPCLTYNINENKGDNFYNCPVVAYYSELLQSNMDSLKQTKFLCPYLNINSEKELSRELTLVLSKHFDFIKKSDVTRAVKAGIAEYHAHMQRVYDEGARAVKFARDKGKRIMILAGRPYHIDPEICHGIDKLATSLGFVVVSEDSVTADKEPPTLGVLNQWTYHSRLYAAAQYASEHDDTQLVQLVSFGCGVDAVTTDEVRSILEHNGKLYTQIKIDEITNLGAVRIRLRSLIGALQERGQ
ncbi:acyl-CoA dehydratase activase-related protein [Ruminococcus sp.]|uniref:acyl-CoA dehydratase activase-related protein n=1 Tax=Ruminococcus sp. TaxID=41978 RepID=UPI002E7FEE47|nr:acyl-CoA dehydratase activase-related protein [Ruminococcus sp.]MEE3491963.1 acyl-CoA dehydratase activase-related protein [Ruminococcus sp.]